jgi:protein phosphatase
MPVVMRALSILPRDRFETPKAFAEALAASIAQVRTRRAFTDSLRWDIGGHTRTGRSKAEMHRSNEDTILIKDDEQGALALVADGVSTCDIGSGGLASMMTAIVIENALSEGCTHELFPALIAAATTRGSVGLLEWALAHGCRADLEAGRDLMGTTLTVAWLQGHEISLANLGDSRAYLVTDDAIEQLTVDGDLASDLLAHGSSPEEIRELGAMARALRECVGGCIRTDDGELGILPESTRPKVSRWPLVPGDVIVLCTDGLVEEGYFLEPNTVAEIVRKYRNRPAADIALLLVDAADALQRLPTVLEPDGFGDNISCIVIKITDAV